MVKARRESGASRNSECGQDLEYSRVMFIENHRLMTVLTYNPAFRLKYPHAQKLIFIRDS